MTKHYVEILINRFYQLVASLASHLDHRILPNIYNNHPEFLFGLFSIQLTIHYEFCKLYLQNVVFVFL